MTRTRLFTALLILLSPPAFALELPVDGRIKLLAYDANDIYTLTTRVGYQTNVEFGQREEIETISVGDRSYWQIIPSGNRLFIRPLESNAATNMTVITSRHSYQFDLKSVDGETRGITYVARFTYPEAQRYRSVEPAGDPFFPEEPPAANASPALPHGYVPSPSPDPSAEPRPVKLTSPPSTPAQAVKSPPKTKRNYKYTFSGPESAAPHEVYDDGATTYLRYRAEPAQDPQFFLPGGGGRETPLTAYRVNEYYAVDTVAREMLVKNGGVNVFIYNEAAAP